MKPPDTRRIAVLCAGYHSNVVMEILRLYPQNTIVAVVDDNAERHGEIKNGVPIVGGQQQLRERCATGDINAVVLGLCNIYLRDVQIRLFEFAASLNVDMLNVLHPTATIAPSATVGSGVFMAANTHIGTGTTVGRNVVIYTGSSIDHDSQIGNNVVIAPGVRTSGQVTIEDGAYISTGAIITSGCTVGCGAIVGAGATVLHDVAPATLALGTPAQSHSTVDAWLARKATR